jgi:nucleoside-diphosphate-sugar epimerase
LRILITGGLGYLGSAIIAEIIKFQPNWKITILDKAIYGTTHIAPLLNQNLDIQISDIRDENALKNLVPNHDCVVHLASLVGAPLVDRKPVEAWDTNVLGTKLLTKYICKSQKFIFASTGSTYGKVDGLCTEETKISPLSSYGYHKALGEEIVAEKDAISLRFATVYGLSYRTRDDLYINSMVQKAIIEKSAVIYESSAMRTFMHVTDAAKAVIHLISNNNHFNVYNVGDENLSYSKKQICELIKQRIDFNFIDSNFKSDPDKRDYVVSYERLVNSGFTCSRRLEDEIDILIHYYSTKFSSGYVNG